MRFRTWPLSALGLGTLLVLVVGALAAAAGKAQDIYAEIDQLNGHHRSVEGMLRQLRDDVQRTGIYVRDHLLETDPSRNLEYAAWIETARRNTLEITSELARLITTEPEDAAQVASLRRHLDDYWATHEPLFGHHPERSLTESVAILRSEVLPRRRAVLAIAAEIEELNDANLTAQRTAVTARQAEFRRDLMRLLALSLALGLAVAVGVVARLRVLERRSEEQRLEAERSEQVMRQLSQQLVAAQEEERRKLSRELHDHVGQTLTALRLELGRIERQSAPASAQIGAAVGESRALVDQMVRTVRDLSLGLRPSMLDDLGLQPALEWHVRDFSRRSGLAVDLNVEGNLDRVPDPHVTCIYRLVQEALTNAVRHSGARRLDISVRGSLGAVDVLIQDDGHGFDPSAARTGIGLRGLEERMRELSGTLTVRSAPGAGTEISAHVPLPSDTGEGTLASAAG